MQKALDFPAARSFTSRKTSVGTEGEKKEILAMRSLTVYSNQDFKTFLSLVTEGLNQNRQVSDNFTACPLMTRTFKLWFKTNSQCNSLQTDLSHAFVALLGLQKYLWFQNLICMLIHPKLLAQLRQHWQFALSPWKNVQYKSFLPVMLTGMWSHPPQGCLITLLLRCVLDTNSRKHYFRRFKLADFIYHTSILTRHLTSI